jgi:hypothetical protein
MKFVLRYSGVLKGNAKASEKEQIRAALSPQLMQLWNTQPMLAEMWKYFEHKASPSESNPFKREFDLQTYICFATEEAGALVDLDILFLRPDAPGRLRDQTGDLDNRMKTLLDGLRPAQNNAERNNKEVITTPIYCLFEDDKLISSLNIRSETLLTHIEENNYVELIITVRTTPSKLTLLSRIYS